MFSAEDLRYGFTEIVGSITKVAEAINNVARATENKSIREVELNIVLKCSANEREVYRDREKLVIHTLDL